MKQIPIKKHELAKNDDKEQLTTLDLVKAVVSSKSSPMEGFEISEVRKRLRILDAVDATHKESTVLELEDADFDYLAKLANSHKWPVIDRMIVEFADSLEKPEAKEAKEKVKKLQPTNGNAH